MYEIIEDSSLTTFEKRVNNYLLKGWQPLGNVTVYINGYGIPTYCQAMIKSLEEKNNKGDNECMPC